MIHLIDMYNKYNLQIHCKDEEFIQEKDRWELFIQRIEGLIGEEEMKKLQKERDEAEKKEKYGETSRNGKSKSSSTRRCS